MGYMNKLEQFKHEFNSRMSGRIKIEEQELRELRAKILASEKYLSDLKNLRVTLEEDAEL